MCQNCDVSADLATLSFATGMHQTLVPVNKRGYRHDSLALQDRGKQNVHQALSSLCKEQSTHAADRLLHVLGA